MAFFETPPMSPLSPVESTIMKHWETNDEHGEIRRSDKENGGEDEMEPVFLDRLPDTNHLIVGRCDKYAVGKKIAQGRFGAVYEVLRHCDGKGFAVKLEVCDSHSHGLDMDCVVLSKAAKADLPNFAHMIDRGKIENHFKFIVMHLMGQNLCHLRYLFVGDRFSLSTALRLSLKCLEAIQQLHQLGFIHRDIKASNFCLAPGCSSKDLRVYLVDFGLCRSYRDEKGQFKTPRTKVSFKGTTRYASLAAHNEKEQSLKDDIESWFYMTIEFITGFLPCRGSVMARVISLKYTPKAEFKRLLKYIDCLSYQSHPDYVYLTQMLQLSMKNHGCKPDDELDWENNNG
ncbi:unnamed protein product, partial [Mesorhabditis belari]|uniref:non-specific serine/threonine protein kinase n=1 Tax=Mesorhabditis belari TaxID=2138241 RepID=A0AAF3FRZ8_9BILA